MLRDVATSFLAAAVLFHGDLNLRDDLKKTAEEAVIELSEKGYTVPTAERPVSIYPLQSGEASSLHAGGWTPGAIYLRSAPHSTFSEQTYLRHELMHEAVSRSCREKTALPEWAEEAVAIAFSGEAGKIDPEFSPQELLSLKKAVRIGASLHSTHRRVLAALVSLHGWPQEPCAVSPIIQKILTNPLEEGGERNGDADLDYVLMHVASGRIFSHQGDTETRRTPIGSLHKIPYVSFLEQKDGDGLGRLLIRSDTNQLELRQSLLFRKELCRLLMFPLRENSVGFTDEANCVSLPSKVLLGESDAQGSTPFHYSLIDAARIVRIALLVKMFQGEGAFYSIPPHSEDRNATLHGASQEFHKELANLNGWAKTGTVSNKIGEPQWGHLVIAWPQRTPMFIALFRSQGVRGASLAERALPLLRSFHAFAQSGKVASIPVVSSLPKAAYSIEGECRGDSRDFTPACALIFGASHARYSWSGNWRVHTSARDARPVRYLRGTLLDQERLLLTDPLTYTDAVSESEGGGLPKAALEALRAVVFWNVTRGRARHPLFHRDGWMKNFSPFLPKVCDTTHCMVFMGEIEIPDEFDGRKRGKRYAQPSQHLLTVLDQLDAKRPLSDRGWFEFSTGGNNRWKRSFLLSEVKVKLNLSELSGVKRFRRRDGAVELHIEAPGGDHTISCDDFSLRLDLPSCPSDVSQNVENSTLDLEGVGAGHGRGLSLLEASELARGGATAEEILLRSQS